MGSLYGFEVESEFPLRRLNAAAGTRGSLTVSAARGPLAPDRGEPVITLVADDGRRYFASHELDGTCLLELPPTGELLLEPRAMRLAVDWRDDDEELLEHRIASAGICTLLAMRGDLVLHAAAVGTDDGAVVFCGPTRRGKSTLAATLGRLGRPLLSEDGVVVELDGAAGPTAYPGARGVRMRLSGGDGRTDLLADPGPSEPSPSPIAAVVLLGERGEALAIEPLERARALALLTPHVVHSGGRAALGGAFARLATLLGAVPAFSASLPDDLAALPAAAEEFLDSAIVRG
jgi:hypothetical protein